MYKSPVLEKIKQHDAEEKEREAKKEEERRLLAERRKFYSKIVYKQGSLLAPLKTGQKAKSQERMVPVNDPKLQFMSQRRRQVKLQGG